MLTLNCYMLIPLSEVKYLMMQLYEDATMNDANKTMGNNFIDALKKLYFLDRSQLPELTAKEWVAFSSDPARFLIFAHIQLQDAIMREINRGR